MAVTSPATGPISAPEDLSPTARTTEVQAGPATDPLAWLAVAAEADEAWFWEVPDDDESWVGLGVATVAFLKWMKIF